MPRPAGYLRHRAEPEDVAIEGDAARDVADVEDGVVEALDGHGDLLGGLGHGLCRSTLGLPRPFRRLICLSDGAQPA